MACLDACEVASVCIGPGGFEAEVMKTEPNYVISLNELDAGEV